MTQKTASSVEQQTEQTLVDAPRVDRTPLHALHLALGAKMAPFAGYDMPISYPLGVMKEHLHTRAEVGVFDVSHMGQAWLEGDDVVEAIEMLVPNDVAALAPGQQRYAQLLNEEGGILDDLMIARTSAAHGRDGLFLVVNAACKEADFAHLEAALAGKATLTRVEDRALIAVQGPKAASLLSAEAPELATLPFMGVARLSLYGVDCLVSRSGYTGEDGYEISLPAEETARLTGLLIDQDGVEMIGLGARDSLRLEAGLCLYGHDMDATITPVEAALTWSISKRRRAEGGFSGASRIQAQLRDGVARTRVGIRPAGRAPAREGVEITDPATGTIIGKITSGGFGPSVGGPIAMGYVPASHALPGTPVNLIIRGKLALAEVVKTPFAPQRYYRG